MPDKKITRFDSREPVREATLHSQLFPQRLDFLNGLSGLFVQWHDALTLRFARRDMEPGGSIGIAIQALQRQPPDLLAPGPAPASG